MFFPMTSTACVAAWVAVRTEANVVPNNMLGMFW
jgi:hypothetical protein